MNKTGDSFERRNLLGGFASFVGYIGSDIAFAARIGIKGIVRPGRTHALPQQLKGAILGIGLSIVPLLVVIVITNGMIDGITKRLIEINTYHIQVSFYGKPSQNLLLNTKNEIAGINGVRFAFVERDGFVQLRNDDKTSGTSLRCTPPELFYNDEGFRRYFAVLEGENTLLTIPRQIRNDVFENKILHQISGKAREVMSDAYEKEISSGMYILKDSLGHDVITSITRSFQNLNTSTILLGKALAEKLKAKPGDMVYLLSFNEFHSRIIPKSGKAIVTGIFSSGYQSIDKFLAYMPYGAAIELVPQNRSSKDLIGIKVDDPFGDMNTILDSINTLLDKKIVFADAQSWYELQINQYRSFQLTKTLLIFIMILIVIVAAANVYSSIVMIVMDRTQEIAILKSMGARPSAITLSFLFTGFYTGSIGALLGIIIGLLLAVNINEVFKIVELGINGSMWVLEKIIAPFYTIEKQEAFVILNPQFYLERIPINISSLEIIFVAFITIVLSVLSAIMPARDAGSIRPIEIIRKY